MRRLERKKGFNPKTLFNILNKKYLTPFDIQYDDENNFYTIKALAQFESNNLINVELDDSATNLHFRMTVNKVPHEELNSFATHLHFYMSEFNLSYKIMLYSKPIFPVNDKYVGDLDDAIISIEYNLAQEALKILFYSYNEPESVILNSVIDACIIMHNKSESKSKLNELHIAFMRCGHINNDLSSLWSLNNNLFEKISEHPIKILNMEGGFKEYDFISKGLTDFILRSKYLEKLSLNETLSFAEEENALRLSRAIQNSSIKKLKLHNIHFGGTRELSLFFSDISKKKSIKEFDVSIIAYQSSGFECTNLPNILKAQDNLLGLIDGFSFSVRHCYYNENFVQTKQSTHDELFNKKIEAILQNKRNEEDKLFGKELGAALLCIKLNVQRNFCEKKEYGGNVIAGAALGAAMSDGIALVMHWAVKDNKLPMDTGVLCITLALGIVAGALLGALAGYEISKPRCIVPQNDGILYEDSKQWRKSMEQAFVSR